MDAFALTFDSMVVWILRFVSGENSSANVTLPTVVLTSVVVGALLSTPLVIGAYFMLSILPQQLNRAPVRADPVVPPSRRRHCPALVSLSERCLQRGSLQTSKTVVRLKTSRDAPYSWRHLTLRHADVQSIEALRSAVRVKLARELGQGQLVLGKLTLVSADGQLTPVETDAEIPAASRNGAALQIELNDNVKAS